MKESLRQLDQRIKRTEKQLKELKAERKKRTRAPFVQCIGNCHGEGCGRKTRVDKLVYIQTYWYTEPFSCSAGDFWTEGEAKFVCPKCLHLNREFSRHDEVLSKHRKHFGEEVEAYDSKDRNYPKNTGKVIREIRADISNEYI